MAAKAGDDIPASGPATEAEPGGLPCTAVGKHRGYADTGPAFSHVIGSGVLLLALAIGCGSGATATPGKSTSLGIDSKAVLRQAVAELLHLESAAFTLEHLQGTTALIPGFLEMKRVSGVVDIPDRFRLKVQAESLAPRAFVEIKIVVIGDQAYMSDPGTGRWGEVSPESLPVNLSNLGQTLAEIIEAVEVRSMVVAEELRGYDTYHIRGRIKSQALADLIPGAGEGLEVKLDLWLEQSRSLLLQVLITGMVIPSDDAGTVRVLTLDDINGPVEISPPG